MKTWMLEWSDNLAWFLNLVISIVLTCSGTGRSISLYFSNASLGLPLCYCRVRGTFSSFPRYQSNSLMSPLGPLASGLEIVQIWADQNSHGLENGAWKGQEPGSRPVSPPPGTPSGHPLSIQKLSNSKIFKNCKLINFFQNKPQIYTFLHPRNSVQCSSPHNKSVR